MWLVRKNLKKTKRRVRDGDPSLVKVLDSQGKPYSPDAIADTPLLLKAILLKYGELVIENGLLDHAAKSELYMFPGGGEIVLGARHTPAPKEHVDDWPPEGSPVSDLRGPRMALELTPLNVETTK